jgi:hypothetical protein
MSEQQINLSISDGDSFFAHQASINFNPTTVHLDFKNVTPRVDERGPNPTLVLKHNLVCLEPYHALMFSQLLNKVIKDYETQFGKIEKPKALKNLEKKMKNKSKKDVLTTNKSKSIDVPSYFG